MEKRKVIFFGAAQTACDFLKKIEQENDKFKYDIVAFSDNNSKLWGKQFLGSEIICPDKICKLDFDYIIILSIYEKEIFKQLIQIGICENKIMTRMEYWKDTYVKFAYEKRYGEELVKNICYKKSVFNTKKMVVYTAIIGDYDDLKEPLYVSDDITYVCFTNNKKIKSKVWDVRYIDVDEDYSLVARRIKMSPHELFKDYETSVWIDAKIQLIGDIREYIHMYEKTSPMLCFPHYERECICDEAAECTRSQRGIKANLLKQVTEYFNAGFPVNWGLYESACIVRNHNDKAVISLMESWKKEIYKHTKRDQLSLPYVCWKNDFCPDICDLYIMDNRWMKMYPHKERRN